MHGSDSSCRLFVTVFGADLLLAFTKRSRKLVGIEFGYSLDAHFGFTNISDMGTGTVARICLMDLTETEKGTRHNELIQACMRSTRVTKQTWKRNLPSPSRQSVILCD
jgi:hypothetical protein